MSDREKRFLEIARSLGYLSSEQAEILENSFRAEQERGGSCNIVQLSLQRGYLSPARIADISVRLASQGGAKTALWVVQTSDAPPRTAAVTKTMAGIPEAKDAPQSGAARRSDPEAAAGISETKESCFGPSMPQAKIEVGDIWSEFEILSKLGEGGMGIVYKAKQRSPERIVALKLLLAQKVSPAQAKRFLQEAQLSAQLGHRNIVKVYLTGTHQGTPFLAMSYVDGMPMQDYLQKEHPLVEKIEIMEKIARALHYAHEQGVVHRDIKPANVLLDSLGEPYLLDFGIARSMRVEDRSLTKTGQILGTPEYMSPEQAQGQRRMVGPHSDIYSLGAMLYQVLAGQTPFVGNSPLEILFKVVNQAVVPPREIDPNIPEGLERIVLKAMARKAEKRYAHAGLMADDLRKFLDGVEVTTAAPVDYGSIFRSRALWATVGALLLGLLIWAWPRSSDRPNEERIDLWPLVQKAQEEGNQAEAERLLKLCIEQNPSHREAMRMRAGLLEKQGKFEEMRFYWARLVELQPSAKDLMDMGEKALNLGYVEDAAGYFQKALDQASHSEACRTRLAEIASCRGDYRTAAEHYSHLDKQGIDALLGMAELDYMRSDYEGALDALGRLGDIERSPGHKARELLLRAQIAWQKCAVRLNRGEWLIEAEKVDPRIESALLEVERNLQASLSESREPSGNAYLSRRVREEAGLYLDALAWEKKISPDVSAGWKDFSKRMQAPSLSHESKIFLQRMLARCLFRNSLWSEAVEHCESAIDEYPWVADFYHIQALSLLQSNEARPAVTCIVRAFKEDPWNFSALENFMILLFDRLTAEEIYYFWQVVISYGTNVYFPLDRMVIEDYIRKERQECLNSYPREVAKAREVNWKMVLETLLSSGEESVRQFALQLLSGQYANREFLGHLSEVRARVRDKRTISDLERLSDSLDRKRRETELRLVKGLVLRYGASPDPKYLLELRRMGEKGERILREIVCSQEDTPIMSLLAAHTLGSLRSLTSFEILRELAASEEYPSNLMASAALRYMAIPVKVSKVFEKKFSPPEAWWTEPEQRLHRILIALYLNPFNNPEIYARLIDGEDQLVALCAVARCRIHLPRLPAPLTEQKVMGRFSQLMRSSDHHVRSLSMRLFCYFHNEYLPHGSEEHIEMCHQQWKDYGEELIDGLRQEKDREIRMSSLVSLVAHREFALYACSAKSRESRSLARLQEILQNMVFSQESEHYLKFWSTVVFSKLDTEGKIWEILSDTQNDFFIRLGVIYSILETASKAPGENIPMQLAALFMNLFPLIERQIGLPPESVHDRRFKQTMIFFMGGIDFPLIPSLPIENKLRPLLESPDAHIRAAAISCLLWRGKRRDIAALSPHLQDDDENVRRATASSMAALTLSYENPAQVESFSRSLQDQPTPIRKAAALGYGTLVYKKVYNFMQFLHSIQITNDHALYLTRLEQGATKDWLRNFDCAIDLYPDPVYYLESAVVAQKFGDLDDAQRRLDLMRANLPKFRNREFLLSSGEILQARILAQRGKTDEALKLLRELSEKHPFDEQPLLHSMKLHMSRDEVPQAREFLWRTYLCNPNTVLSIVDSCIQENRLLDAIHLLREIDAKYPVSQELILQNFPGLLSDQRVKDLLD